MQLTIAILPLLSAMLGSASAGNCIGGNAAGLANGECVQYYGGEGCKGSPIGSYKPTCAGNCFQYDHYNSLHVAGDGTYGTNCVAYSDTNCQTEMTETGNAVVGQGKCITVPNAKSMKCYYRC